jgi:hypothetical protein
MQASELNCFDCQHRFNLTSREPIFMICCGLTACKNCVTTKMIKNPQHSARGLAKKGEFECSNCRSNVYNSFTDHAVELKVNINFKKMIERS